MLDWNVQILIGTYTGNSAYLIAVIIVCARKWVNVYKLKEIGGT